MPNSDAISLVFMSSLLRPVVDPCQSTLRERRRSSVHPLTAMPRLFSSSAAEEGSAISDDHSDPPDYHTAKPQNLQIEITPLTGAHVSDYATKITIPRHNNPPSLHTNDVYSSPSVFLPSAGLSRKSSVAELGRSSHHDVDTQSLTHDRMNWRLASGFFAYFMCGWGDGITGTVLPYFVAEYHLTSMTSSLLFTGSTCGFLIGTLLVENIIKYFGPADLGQSKTSLFPRYSTPFRVLFPSTRSKRDIGYSAVQARQLTLLYGSILHGMFFVMMGAKGGFPVLFMAYALAAFARSMLTAALNVYYASVYPQSLSYSFAFWSFGGVASPLICQAIVASGVPWFHFYFGSLVLSAINAAFLTTTFNPTPREFAMEKHAVLELRHQSQSPVALSYSPTGDTKSQPELNTHFDTTGPPENTLRLTLSLPLQWAISLFVLLYCGSETTTQGFMVTYLLGTRHANPKTAGYVTSGFWGGITVGRLLWGYYMPSLDFIRRKHTVQVCLSVEYISVVALVMQILIWVVDSNIANAFSASLIGLLYGPTFPACLSLANAVLPKRVQLVSMALILTCASFGAALFPFVAGAIANVKGIQTLTYLTVPLGITLAILWALLPSRVISQI